MNDVERLHFNKPANLGQFPYLIALLYRNFRIKCTGVLLTQYHILTAARCVITRETDLDQSDLKYAMAGDIIHVENVVNAYQELREINVILIHPEYVGSKNIRFDIAVLKVEEKFPLNKYLHYAKFGGYSPIEWWYQRELTLVGWGEFVPGGNCDHRLRYSPVQMNPKGTCSLPKGEDLFCGENKYGCNGAVGSPLMVGKEVRGIYLESRYNETLRKTFSIYLRIHHQLFWIYQALASEKFSSPKLKQSSQTNNTGVGLSESSKDRLNYPLLFVTIVTYLSY